MESHESGRVSAVQNGDVIAERVRDDGTFPNNEYLQVLLYRGVFVLATSEPAARIEEVFRGNGWGGTWRDGIYPYHHYHSTAHEVLGVAGGTARVQLGGDAGPQFELAAGDALVIPAGVAHKNLGSSSDFQVVGAYPAGQEYDMNYGKPAERPAADRNVAQTPLPSTDPVFGSEGPVIERWLS